MQTRYVWKDIDETQPSAKTMRFWTKALAAPAQDAR